MQAVPKYEISGDRFFAGGVDLLDVVSKYGTPLYVVNGERILYKYQVLKAAFDEVYPDAKICYSYKANANLAICALLKKEGAGAAVASLGGLLAASKVGVPSGELGFAHDEINLILPGKNYGWPIIVGGGNDPRFVDPLIDTGDETWAPSGASFYVGDQIPQWKDSFFVATLRGVHLHRIVFSAQGDSVVFHEKLYDSEFGRLRDVLTGPDGALYVVTNNTDGRGSQRPSDDRILRLFSKR